jgi:predicted dehydrogenase
MAVTEPLRVGLLGAGMIATCDYGILPNLGPLSGRVQIVAIANSTMEKAARVAREFAIPASYSSLEAMLEGSELDAVVNLTPILVHGRTSIAILAAGKHLVTEKPLATTMDEADTIVQMASDQGLVVVCSPPNMVLPSRRRARRLLEEGAIGRVAFARVRGSHAGPASYGWPSDPSWFYQEGAGPLLDLGVYALAEITGLLGPARRVSAFSGITDALRRVQGGPFDGQTIEVTTDDNVVLMLDFGSSTFALVDATFNVNAASSPGLEIFGSDGTMTLTETISFTGRGAVLHVGAGGGPGQPSKWRVVDQSEDADQESKVQSLKRAVLLDHLVECVEGADVTLSAEHGRHVLEVMLQAQKSAISGRAMDVTSTFSLPVARI